ncbi:MAG: PAS domain S-box protein [Calditrichia bacterium]
MGKPIINNKHAGPDKIKENDYELAPAGMFVLDKQQHIRRVNAAGCRMLQSEKEQLINIAFSRYVSLEDKPLLAEFLKNLWNAGDAENIRLQLTTSDAVLPVQLSGLPLSDTEVMIAVSGLNVSPGSAVSVPAGSQDLAERGENRSLLFNIMSHTIPGFVYLSDLSGEAEFFNDFFYAITGLGPAGAAGKKWLQKVHPDERPNLEKFWNKAAKSKKAFKVEYRLKNKQGIYQQFIQHSSLLFDPQNRPVKWISICTAIDAFKAIEDQIWESEERYHVLFSTMLHGVIFVDADGNYISANPAASEILGRSFSEIKDMFTQKWPRVVHKVDGSEMKPEEFPVQIALSSGQKVENMLLGVYNPVDKDHRWLNVSAIPLFRENAEHPYMAYVNFIDITRIRHQEMELKQSEKQFRTSIESLITPFCILKEMPGCEDGDKINFSFQYLNNAAEKTIKKDPQGIIGKPFFQPPFTESQENLRQIFKQVMQKSASRMEMAVPYCGWPFNEDKKRFYDISVARLFDGLIVTWLDVTEKKEAEEELRKLVMAVEQNPVAVMIADAEGRIQYVNPKYCETSGYSSEEVLGKKPGILKSGTTPGEVYDSLWRTIRSGQIWNGELLNKKKSGELYWEDISIAPVVEPGGKITHFVEVKEDITDRKQLEEERQRLAAIVDSTLDGIVGKTLEGVITSWNYGAERIYGYTAEEAVGKHITLIFPPDRISEHEYILNSILTGKKLEQFETVRICKDGRIVNISLTISPIKNKQGKIVAFSTVERDITSRKAAERKMQDLVEKLDHEHRRMRAILDVIPMALYLADKEGHIVLSNPSAEKIWEFQINDSLDMQDYGPVFKAWWSDTGKRIGSEDWGIARALTRGEVSTAEEIEIETGSGKRKTILNYAVPIYDANGNINGAVAVNVDISIRKKAEEAVRRINSELEERIQERTRELVLTNETLQEEILERRRTEEQLKIHTRKLEISNKMLEDFAFMASHDLQEPLRKIQSFGDRLVQKYGNKLEETGQDYLNRMTNAARRMREQINALLDYSRITTHAKPFVRTNLNTVMAEVLSQLESQIEATGGKVRFGKLHSVEAEPNQIIQLFQNLISNSLKFNRPGIPPEVTVSSSLFNGNNKKGPFLNRQYCSVEIRDNGIGFEQKFSEKIFAPFQRLHSRQSFEGTGIGLAICRKIVERHNGTITATSKRGEGAVFTVNLPVKQVQQGDLI